MFNYLQSYIGAFRYIKGLVQFDEKKINEINFQDESYNGLDNQETILRVFQTNKKNAQPIIIFPGASPYAEEHPGMIMLGHALRNAGYNVFLPRIPNLKKLILVKENVDWFAHCYIELAKHKLIKNKKILVVGLSYGGANLLKASLDDRIQNNPPKSILSYGTYYSIETALDFFTSGKIEYNNKHYSITPHEWGPIVIFYNFLNSIETNYDTKKITKLLKFRIEDKDTQVESMLQTLNNKEKKIVQKILKGTIDLELKTLIKHMLNKNKELLEYLSPNNWSEKINNMVFIIHGANDSMVPFTESVFLSKTIPKSKLLISFLYEHKEISTNRGPIFKIKELIKMVNFFAYYFRYNK